MYRNTYLQLYKNSASHQQNPTILLSHFSQIYNTLGCVLQDLEYQIGRLQLQSSRIDHPNQQNRGNQYKNYQKEQKGRASERTIVKIQESCEEDGGEKCRNVAEEGRDGKGNLRKRVQIDEAIKYEQDHPKQPPSKSPQISERNSKQKESGKRSPVLVSEKVRERPKHPISSDTFDDLFGKSNPNPRASISYQQPKSPIVPQHPATPQNSQPQNTYDDFLDRIFKETEGRKSR